MNFFHAYKRPKTYGQKFDHVFEWNYVDESTGELIEDSIDQKEALQSHTFLTPSDIINKGFVGLEQLNLHNPQGVYLDISGVSDIETLMDMAQALILSKNEQYTVESEDSSDGDVSEKSE